MPDLTKISDEIHHELGDRLEGPLRKLAGDFSLSAFECYKPDPALSNNFTPERLSLLVRMLFMVTSLFTSFVESDYQDGFLKIKVKKITEGADMIDDYKQKAYTEFHAFLKQYATRMCKTIVQYILAESHCQPKTKTQNKIDADKGFMDMKHAFYSFNDRTILQTIAGRFFVCGHDKKPLITPCVTNLDCRQVQSDIIDALAHVLRQTDENAGKTHLMQILREKVKEIINCPKTTPVADRATAAAAQTLKSSASCSAKKQTTKKAKIAEAVVVPSADKVDTRDEEERLAKAVAATKAYQAEREAEEAKREAEEAMRQAIEAEAARKAAESDMKLEADLRAIREQTAREVAASEAERKVIAARTETIEARKREMEQERLLLEAQENLLAVKERVTPAPSRAASPGPPQKRNSPPPCDGRLTGKRQRNPTKALDPNAFGPRGGAAQS